MIRAANLAWKGSLGAALVGMVPTGGDDAIAWFMKAMFGLMLAIIAYFVKQIADQIKANQGELERQGRAIKRHNILFQYFLNNAKSELDARGGENGRRKTDTALVALLEAVQADGEIE
jgi:hypothetical protein